MGVSTLRRFKFVSSMEAGWRSYNTSDTYLKISKLSGGCSIRTGDVGFGASILGGVDISWSIVRKYVRVCGIFVHGLCWWSHYGLCVYV